MKKINFISAAMLALFCAMAGLSGCNGGHTEPDPNDTLTGTIIGKGSLFGNGAEGFSKQFSVIKTAADWENLKTQLNSVNNVTDSFTETDIDFSLYQVIFVIDKIKGSGGWSIDVTDITENSNDIVVTVSNLQTGNASSVMTQPFEVVKIPVSNKQVVFEDSTVNNEPLITLPTEPVNPELLIGKWELFEYVDLITNIVTTKPDDITGSVVIEFLNTIIEGSCGSGINFRLKSLLNEMEGEYILTGCSIQFISSCCTTALEPDWWQNSFYAITEVDLIKIETNVLCLFYNQSQTVMLFNKII